MGHEIHGHIRGFQLRAAGPIGRGIQCGGNSSAATRLHTHTRCGFGLPLYSNANNTTLILTQVVFDDLDPEDKLEFGDVAQGIKKQKAQRLRETIKRQGGFGQRDAKRRRTGG